MDFLAPLLSLFLIWSCIWFLRPRRCTGKAPPGPWPLPVVGNILDLGPEPHRAFARLSQKYGPVMSLKLGTNRVVVISSPKAIQDALQKNEKAISSRSIPAVMMAGDHSKYSLIWLPATEKWKSLRRVCSMQMFSPQKLKATEPLRRKKVDELLEYLHQSSIEGRVVDIGKAGFITILNLMSNTLFSIDFAHYAGKSEFSEEFNDLFRKLMKEAGTPNISDFFPALQFLDLQRIRRRAESYRSRLIAVFEKIVAEKKQSRAWPVDDGGSPCKDMLDALLDLEESGELGHSELLCLLMDLIIAGTDTSQATIEWAMAELMKNPGKMAKAKAELQQEIGKGIKVQEQHIPMLPYLQAVVKETLRMHPSVPLLLPHKAETQVNICGFDLPQDTQIIFNVWAMGLDPAVWVDPMHFEPERFLETDIDAKGKNFEFIPFGAGRRICPGMPLANITVPLTLASMIHSFDWELVDRETPQSLDMTEKFSLTLQKAKPLCIKPLK